MNRTLTTLAATALFLAPSLALAASIQLTPSTVSVVAGQTFTVTVVAHPDGAPLYTASANLGFNPSLLEVMNFSFAANWMPVTQAGYDSTDNNAGVLIKTAGLPGGFTAATNLGTITFRAKAAGNATVTATGNSTLLDGGSANEISGAQGSVAVTITNAPAATAGSQTGSTAQVPVPNNSGPIPGQSNTSASASTTDAGQAASVAAALGTSSQTAAVGSLFSGVPSWLWWLLAIIVVLAIGYWGWRQFASNS